jgi:hypothetical protein
MPPLPKRRGVWFLGKPQSHRIVDDTVEGGALSSYACAEVCHRGLPLILCTNIEAMVDMNSGKA